MKIDGEREREREEAETGRQGQGGISGGEKKRTAIGMELITNPSILFLDEPTTGLDTYTAYSVMHTLHSLAQAGRTGVTVFMCLVKM